jgi:hypothetical protein
MCQKGYVDYTIKAGDHYCDRSGLSLFTSDELRFSVIFNDTAIYANRNPSNQSDINKLFGFREGLSEDNSARMGWNWMGGAIWLYPYVHAGGVNFGAKDPAAICAVPIGQEIPCAIKCLSKSEYLFTVMDYQVKHLRGKGSWLKFLNYPYFGGDETAPHDVLIKIKRL